MFFKTGVSIRVVFLLVLSIQFVFMTSHAGGYQDVKHCYVQSETASGLDMGKLYACRGEVALQQNNPSKAIDEFTSALDYRPTAATYYLRGTAYKAIGQPQKAAQDFARAKQLK